MTPEERQLITGLFDRMRGFALTEKDGEAEALIKEQVASLPDAAYMLVQSVLVQEHALQQADSRIKALEEQVRELQAAQQRAQPSSGSGSFLGGLFGSKAASEPARGASVPMVGARATPPPNGGSRPAWGAPQAGAPTAAPQSTGGGFLQSAMATAAGVAGGMLAANAISSWLGGSGAHSSASTASTSAPQPTQTAATEGVSTGGPTEASHAGGVQDSDYHDTSYEDDGGWFGGDSDFDI